MYIYTYMHIYNMYAYMCVCVPVYYAIAHVPTATPPC